MKKERILKVFIAFIFVLGICMAEAVAFAPRKNIKLTPAEQKSNTRYFDYWYYKTDNVEVNVKKFYSNNTYIFKDDDNYIFKKGAHLVPEAYNVNTVYKNGILTVSFNKTGPAASFQLEDGRKNSQQWTTLGWRQEIRQVERKAVSLNVNVYPAGELIGRSETATKEWWTYRVPNARNIRVEIANVSDVFIKGNRTDPADRKYDCQVNFRIVSVLNTMQGGHAEDINANTFSSINYDAPQRLLTCQLPSRIAKYMDACPSKIETTGNAPASDATIAGNSYARGLVGWGYIRLYADKEYTKCLNSVDEADGKLFEGYILSYYKPAQYQTWQIRLSKDVYAGLNGVYPELTIIWETADGERESYTKFVSRSNNPINIKFDYTAPQISVKGEKDGVIIVKDTSEIELTVEDTGSGLDDVRYNIYKVEDYDEADKINDEFAILKDFDRIGLTSSKLLYSFGRNKKAKDVKTMSNVDITESEESELYVLAVYAEDNQKNHDSNYYRFRIDKTKPEIEITDWKGSDKGKLKLTDSSLRGFNIVGKMDDKSIEHGECEADLVVGNKAFPLNVSVYGEKGKKNKDFQVYLKDDADVDLVNGITKALLRVKDPAGNTTELEFDLEVDLFDFKTEFKDVVYVSGGAEGGKTTLYGGLGFKAKEDTYVTIEDENGNVLVKDAPVSNRDMKIYQFEKPLKEGEYNLKAKIKNSKGDYGQGSTFKLIVDNAPPKVKAENKKNGKEILDSYSGVNYINSGEIVFDAEINEKSPWTMKFMVDPKDDGDETWSKFAFIGESNFPVVLESIPDGEHKVYMLVKDEAGNNARIVYPFEINSTKQKIWLNPENIWGSKDGNIEEGSSVQAVYGGSPNGIIISGVSNNRDYCEVSVKGSKRVIAKTEQYTKDRGWSIQIPADMIPTKRNSLVTIELKDKYGTITEIPVEIVAATDVPEIVLSEKVPEYLNKDEFIVEGKIISNVDISDLYVKFGQDDKIFIIENGSVVENKWYDTKYNPEDKKFYLKIKGIKENYASASYPVLIYTRNIAENEYVYEQTAVNGAKSIPYIWVKYNPPQKPNMKLIAVTGRNVSIEGNAELNTEVIIENESGSTLTTVKGIYPDDDSTMGRWQKEIKYLPAGDYVLHSIAKDFAGNTSGKSNKVKFTILGTAEVKPRIVYPVPDSVINQDRYPEVRGEVSVPNAAVLIFDNGQRMGETASDETGSFTFKSDLPMFNGYHNITARVYKDYILSDESEVCSFELRVVGAPSMNTLMIETSGRTFKELQDIPVVVRDTSDQPVRSASVWIRKNEKMVTDKEGKAYVRAPGVKDGEHVVNMTIYAEKSDDTGKFAGSTQLVVYDGGTPKIAFSPNSDGKNDFIEYKSEELPVRIYNRGNKKIKTVTSADGGRWDGMMDNGWKAEMGLFYSETVQGRKTFIQLSR